MAPDCEKGEPLVGGNASVGVVRVGDTVRKPWSLTTERTACYVRALHDRGVDVPLMRGRDEAGRQTWDFIPGRVAMSDVPLGVETVRRVGSLVRSIHDASAGLPVPGGWEVLIPTESPDLLCHNDLAAWNLVIDGDRMVFIDWDGAGPSTRLWDLAYAAISFSHLFAGAAPAESAARLSAFADGYGADVELRLALPATMAMRARAMHELLRRSHATGREPWGSMYVDGHGETWAGATAFIAEHRRRWLRALQ